MLHYINLALVIIVTHSYTCQAVTPAEEFNTEEVRQVGILMKDFHSEAIAVYMVDITNNQAIKKFLRQNKGKRYKVSKSGICSLERLITIARNLEDDITDSISLQQDLIVLYNSYLDGETAPDDFKLSLAIYGLKNVKQLNRSVAQSLQKAERYERIKNKVDDLIKITLPSAFTAEKAWNYFSNNLPNYFVGNIQVGLEPKFIAYMQTDYGLA